MHACYDRALAVTAMFKASSANPYGCDASTCTLRTGDVVETLPLAQAVVYLDLAYRHVPPSPPSLYISLPLCLLFMSVCLLSVCLLSFCLPACLPSSPSPPHYHLRISALSISHTQHSCVMHSRACTYTLLCAG